MQLVMRQPPPVIARLVDEQLILRRRDN
jgi:hypothetical protein